MVDYAKLIDAETWAFIAETDRWYPPDAATRSIAEQRAVYDAMCRAFFHGYPDGVTARDTSAHGVPVRCYKRASSGTGPVVIYFHGGGHVVGGLDSHDDVCAEICEATGYRVFAVDYRLSPEHEHPAALDDCQSVLEWTRSSIGAPVVLAGDSAGGNLAAAVAHRNRGAAEIRGQVLIYPGLGGERSTGSRQIHANAPMLTLADIDFYATVRTGGQLRVPDATLAPLLDTDFSGLPPTVAIAAECDPLCDDAAEYAGAIANAGGNAVSFVEPGLVHGYLRARHTAKRARRSFARITRAISILGSGGALSRRLLDENAFQI